MSDLGQQLKAGETQIMPCACGPNDQIGTHSNAVAVPIPPHMEDYKTNRMAAGLSGTVGVDRCILKEIQTLWTHGIRTYGSCCGHGQLPSMVNVHEGDVTAMEALGYRPWPHPVETPTFCLTSGTTRLEQEP